MIRLQDVPGRLVDDDDGSARLLNPGEVQRNLPCIALVFQHGRLLDRIEVWIVRREITFRDSRSRKLRRLHRHVLRKCMRRSNDHNSGQSPSKTQFYCNAFHATIWRSDIRSAEKQNPDAAFAHPGFNRKRRAFARRFEMISCPRSSAASATLTDASASLAPSPRSGGYALSSPRTAGRPLRACGRCSCRCRSACGARVLRAG
jgi:hypothetical protein